jgi:hypothetical protein
VDVSILDGQYRYAHVAGLRGDAVAPQILGMKKIISDESLRRALAHLAPEQDGVRSAEARAARAAQLAKSTAWMDAAAEVPEALRRLILAATPPSLRMAARRAEVGYNRKPGRPAMSCTLTDRRYPPGARCR